MMTAEQIREAIEAIRRDTQDIGSILAESGNRAVSRTNRVNAQYMTLLNEAGQLLQGVLKGTRPSSDLMEAMSTSDFPLLLGDILDRQLLAQYQTAPVTWPAYARRGTNRDFRQAARLTFDGLTGRLYPNYLKTELGPGREDAPSEGEYLTQVEVYEKQVAMSWQTLVNDDLDAFGRIPGALATGARLSEEYLAASLFVDSNGPHDSLYSAGNANIINPTNGATATNPPLSIAGVQDGFTVLARQRDASGEPIVLTSAVLVVPPALEVVANNIINGTTIRLTGNGGVAGQELEVANWLRGRLRVEVNPYIPVIATSNGATTWFLFADPNVGRPALEISFLRGYEEPGIYQKAPEHMRVGGGLLPQLGSFDFGEIRWKVMHIIGGARLDPKGTVASNGTGV